MFYIDLVALYCVCVLSSFLFANKGLIKVMYSC